MSPEFEQAYEKLAALLQTLIERADAANAFVFDAWGVIWCSASLTFGSDERRLHLEVRDVLESLDPPLASGTKVDRIFVYGEFSMYCMSFGTTYMLGVWTAPTTNEFALRRCVRDALPAVEALTLALPPPDGSGSSSGAQHA